jgi:transposase-like protein
MSIDLKTANEMEALIDVVKKRKKTKKRTPFPVEFKAAAAACWRRSGLSKNKFAKSLGVSDSLIHNWDVAYPAGTKEKATKIVATDTATKILLKAAHGYLTQFESGSRTDESTGESNLVCASTIIQLLMEKEGDANPL